MQALSKPHASSAQDAISDPALVAECRAIVARHAHSFDRACRFLPRQTRDRVAVLYAFCRLVDDAVDEAPDAHRAALAIGALHRELGVATGAPGAIGATGAGADVIVPRPVIRAFVQCLGRSEAAIAAAHELTEGVAADLRPARFADDAELLRYCYRVAGTVGVLMTPTLGVVDPAGMPFAVDFGIAMQLTNICRDVREDAARGRVYLPATRLLRHGTSQAALLRGDADAGAVARVVLELLALADRYYASCDLGMRYIPLAARQAILVSRALYAGIGWKLRRQGGDALAGRTIVGRIEKAALIARGLSQNLRPQTHGLGPAPMHDWTLHTHLGDFPGTNPRVRR